MSREVVWHTPCADLELDDSMRPYCIVTLAAKLKGRYCSSSLLTRRRVDAFTEGWVVRLCVAIVKRRVPFPARRLCQSCGQSRLLISQRCCGFKATDVDVRGDGGQKCSQLGPSTAEVLGGHLLVLTRIEERAKTQASFTCHCRHTALYAQPPNPFSNASRDCG